MATNDVYKDKKRNVDEELYDAWLKAYKKSDYKELAKYTGYSVPVIYAAIKRGYVYNPELVEMITNFFKERKERELSQSAKTLIQLSQ